jgi:hypothetical protein
MNHSPPDAKHYVTQNIPTGTTNKVSIRSTGVKEINTGAQQQLQNLRRPF